MKLIQTSVTVALAACAFFSASCRKAVEKELDREVNQLTGTWTVSEMRYVQTDTLGKTLRDTAITDAGKLEFRRASKEGADVFHPLLFRGACAESDLVQYFQNQGAGDPVTGGGWSLYWDADPAGERLIVWGIGPSSSYHRVLNFDGDGDRRTMWYMEPAIVGTSRRFYYFEIEK